MNKTITPGQVKKTVHKYTTEITFVDESNCSGFTNACTNGYNVKLKPHISLRLQSGDDKYISIIYGKIWGEERCLQFQQSGLRSGDIVDIEGIFNAYIDKNNKARLSINIYSIQKSNIEGNENAKSSDLDIDTNIVLNDEVPF